MGPIEEAVEKFRNTRLVVYRTDRDQIVRDFHGADRAAKDHVGRWFYELFQNSDDAGAEEVLALITSRVVYVADTGKGLESTAVKAICGTDFSDKTAGTIGRKGVGFKSVYEISETPQVFTLNGEGIEFSCEKTQEWLLQNGFGRTHVPYQWIPFFISRSNAEGEDTNLCDLSHYSTIVKLPLNESDRSEKTMQQLNWPSHALLPFQHVRKLEIRSVSNKEPLVRLFVVPNGDNWTIEDNRLGSDPVYWRVAKHTEQPLKSVLNELNPDERERIEKDGVSFLVAAPLKGGQRVFPIEGYLPVHVFYPTEQEGPVRMVLHAEFLVKSDRTALIPIEDSAFNQWVSDRLACHVCEFVQNAFIGEKPSINLALLVPFEDRDTHPVAGAIWDRIAQVAHNSLRLGDVEGKPFLTLADARLISVSVDSVHARRLLEATELRRQLLHHTYDEDTESRKALKALECKKIGDEDLMQAIKENAILKFEDQDWVWTCWKWVAAWVADEPYGDKHKERVRRAKELPIIPVNGRLRRADDLSDYIVTWRADGCIDNLPDWLPLTFIEDWFRDRVKNMPPPAKGQSSPIAELLKELGIQKPSDDVVPRSMGQAIRQYWKAPSGDPGRFMRYIFDQDWHEKLEPNGYLLHCPVPALVQGRDALTTWIKASEAYFGNEWENHSLVKLFENIDGIPWVKASFAKSNKDKEYKILEWLGCKAFPRIVEKPPQGFISEHREDYNRWRWECFGDTDGRYPETDSVHCLEHLSVRELRNTQVCALLTLLAHYWEEYYYGTSKTEIHWYYRRPRSRLVDAFWWYQIKRELRPPINWSSPLYSLNKCWLPDRRTNRAIRDLLPIIDIQMFEEDRDKVHDWLVNVVEVRTRIDQIKVDEWRDILSKVIPDLVPVKSMESDEGLRDRVAKWYESCLDAVSEQEKVDSGAFRSCPLLCQKGNEWAYVTNNEVRYFADDDELVKAFASDGWLLHIPSRLRDAVKKYFGVPALFKSVEVKIVPGGPAKTLDGDLRTRFNEALPYVFALRCVQAKQDTEKLRSQMKSLKVEIVPSLTAHIVLEGVSREVIRPCSVSEGHLFVSEEHVNESFLALALAEAIGVKSEADLYENLLRCNGNAQRKDKLLAKGIPEAEVDRWLREYSDIPQAEVERKVEPATQTEPEGDVKPPHKETGVGSGVSVLTPPDVQRLDEAPPATEEASKTDRLPEKTPDSNQLDLVESAVETSKTEKQLLLKDPDSAEYSVASAPPTGSGGNGGGGITSHEPLVLSQEERLEIEKCGRLFAQRELEKLGYEVEQMPVENPGFDLRATRGDEELRIEVKAHLGKGTIVEVSREQYLQYLGSRRMGHEKYAWELWNIEHLSEKERTCIEITKYVCIPEEALDTRLFRVDLKKCETKASN